MKRRASTANLGSCATPPSTKKGAFEDTDDTIHLPRPKKTGNRIVDEDNLNQHICLEEMVTTVIRHRHHTMPLYLALQRRLREEAADETTIEGGELFDKAPNLIKSVDEEWVINWLASQSSFTADEIVKARKADPEAPYQLLAFALQLGLHMRLPESCRTKEVLWKVFTERAAMCGQRLNDFKKRAPMDKAGRLCWQKGSYTLVWAEGRLGSIQHCDGEKVDVGDTYSKEYKLEFNWNDWDAQLKKGKFPGIKLHLFFEGSQTGPYALQQWSNKSKEWPAFVKSVADKWTDERQSTLVGAKANDCVAQALQLVKAEQKATSLEKARGKAKELMEKRRKDRTVTFE